MSRRDHAKTSTEDRRNRHIRLSAALRDIKEKEDIERQTILELLKRSSIDAHRSNEGEEPEDEENTKHEDRSHG